MKSLSGRTLKGARLINIEFSFTKLYILKYLSILLLISIEEPVIKFLKQYTPDLSLFSLNISSLYVAQSLYTLIGIRSSALMEYARFIIFFSPQGGGEQKNFA